MAAPRGAYPRSLYARAGGKLAFEPPPATADGDPGFDACCLTDPPTGPRSDPGRSARTASLTVYRRRHSSRPEPLTADRVECHVTDLHHGAHRFRKGHKVMVQVQSTWFPLIDRNPQTYVPNIYRVKETDFRPATQRVFRTERYPTVIELTVLPD